MKRQPLRSAAEQEPIPEGWGRVRQQHASFSPSPFLFVEALLGTVQEAVSWNWRLPSANTGHMKMSQKDNRRRMEVPMSSKFWHWMEIKSPLSTSLICLIKGMWLIPIHWGLVRRDCWEMAFEIMCAIDCSSQSVGSNYCIIPWLVEWPHYRKICEVGKA